MSNAKILLLEDDVNLNDTICEFLEESGYEIDALYDGDEAEDSIYEKRYDLYLLDVNVPGINGFDLLKKIREEGNTTPAIYLTSLNSVDDLSVGFENGCDDYIRKPFALKELLIRVESILKREFFHQKSEKIEIAKNIEYEINTNELFINQEVIRLQNKEAVLLKLFLQRRGEIISHDVIANELWGYDEVASDTALRTYIKNLRKLLGKEKIVSAKKLGYKFTSE